MKKLHLLAAALLTVGYLGTAQAATISLIPTTQNVALGSSFLVDVMFNADGGNVGVGAFDLNVNFDASKLSFQTVAYGNGLDIFGLGDVQTTTPANGSVNLYELSLDSIQDILSNQVTSFKFATLTFSALTAGQSNLDIAVNSLADASGNALSASVLPATINVAPVPVPAAAWLFGASLAGLTGLTRKRKAS